MIRTRIFTILLLLPFTGFGAGKDVRPYIAVETGSTGLYFTVNDDGELKQRHYGPRIVDPSQLLAQPDGTHDAFPAYGDGNPDESALEILHADGNPTTRLIYASHRTFSDPALPGAECTEIVCRDPNYPVTVTLAFRAYADENVIQVRTTVVSDEPRIVVYRAASVYLSLVSEAFYLDHLYGTQGYETLLQGERLTEGVKLFDSKRGARNAHVDNPSFMLSLGRPAGEESGEVIGGTLCWTGNFRMAYQKDAARTCRIVAGTNNPVGGYVLGRGERLDTPWFALTYSDRGKGQITRNFHDWGRRLLNEPARIRPVVLNSWEGVGLDFDEKTIVGMIGDAAGLGAEVFVLDDGWYGNKYPRNDERTGLGDWDYNRQKLPHGLKPLVDATRKHGIVFGIWIEPEMINRSELAERHPEWIVASPNREPLLKLSRQQGQQLLDMTNPEVQDFVFGVFDKLLTENPEIGYVKWDANRYAPDHGSACLPGDKQTNFWFDYVRGLYKVYERIGEKYPHVILQLCSSGGGRLDWGALDYHHEFWPSDNTDALHRVFIQWGTGLFFPAIATAAHISKVPNHTSGRSTSLKFRIDVAMSGRLGVELQPKQLDREESETIRRAIAEYKCIREVVQLGDLYRFVSPYEETYAALAYIAKDKRRAVAFCYVTEHNPVQECPVIRFRGLDPAATYRITEVNPGDTPGSPAVGKCFTGDFLMTYGIRINCWRQAESAVFELNAI